MTEIYQQHFEVIESWYEPDTAAKECEKITHESMIKFAEWIDDNCLVFMGWDRWGSTNKDCKITAKTTEELLQLYLKEE